jgi:H+/Cl- antiporter ClcA
MHRFALRGQWLGSGLAVAFGSAVGMLVGYWTSDRRQKNGWLVAGIAGTVALSP